MKKIFLVLSIGLLMNGRYCFAQPGFNAALQEYLHGDLNKAVEMFSALIESKTEIAKSHMYRGAAKSFLFKLDEALADLDSARAIDSSIKRLNFYYGKVYLFNKEYAMAESFYTKQILKEPGDAAGYAERAQAKIMLEDYANAVKDMNRAIKIDSSDESFFITRGWAKTKQHKFKDAIKDFDKSIQLKPGQKSFADRGYAFAALHEYAKAIVDFSSSLSINPADPEIYYYRGLAYKNSKQPLEACMDFKKCKALGSGLATMELADLSCN